MRNTTASRSGSTKASKTVTTKTVTKKVTPTKKVTVAKKETKATTAAPSVDLTRAITAEQRHSMICEAAYYIAEKTGFNPSLSHHHWLEAERQIDTQILGL